MNVSIFFLNKEVFPSEKIKTKNFMIQKNNRHTNEKQTHLHFRLGFSIVLYPHDQQTNQHIRCRIQLYREECVRIATFVIYDRF